MLIKRHLLSLLILILISSLEGCRSQEVKYQGEQCSPVFVYTDASQSFIDVVKSYCNVREYEMDIHHVGPLPGTDHKRELQYCDRCMGFKDYASVITFAETVRRMASEGNNEPRPKKP